MPWVEDLGVWAAHALQSPVNYIVNPGCWTKNAGFSLSSFGLVFILSFFTVSLLLLNKIVYFVPFYGRSM